MSAALLGTLRTRVEWPVMELESDTELLAAISQRRDRTAFADFASRHQHAAFNLALHLTQRHETAEEVVQEALLRAWKGAATYREEGKPRSWFLRIVAREALRRAKDKQKERRQMSLDETNPAAAQGQTPPQSLEREEQLAALRRGLTQLPSIHRRVVALYYVAGMEQAEIGAELALSQQAVSLRIQEALGQLRELLGRAGFTSALPLLTMEGFEAAFNFGGHAPAGFLEQTLERIANLGEAAQSVRHSRRLVAAKSGGSVYLAVGAFLAFSAGAGWLLLSQPLPAVQKENPEPEKRAPATEVVAKPNVTEPPAPPAPAALERRWSFEKGPAPELQPLKGRWSWEQGPRQAPGWMLAPPQEEVQVLFPFRPPAIPFEVNIEFEVFDPKNMGHIAVAWMDGVGTIILGSAWNGPRINLPDRKVLLLRHVLIGRHLIRYYEGKVNAVRTLPKAPPSEYVGFTAEACRIRWIQVRTLRPDELTRELRDPAAFLERCERYHREGLAPKLAVEKARD